MFAKLFKKNIYIYIVVQLCDGFLAHTVYPIVEVCCKKGADCTIMTKKLASQLV